MLKQTLYKRPIPPNMYKESTNMSKRLDTGSLIEFIYGRKQKPGQVGGWKTDKVPRLVVFYDDGQRYVEGINTNYLPNRYLAKLLKLVMDFPGISGEELYDVIKTSARPAVEKGYRKYIRSSFKNIYKLKVRDKK